MSFKILYEYVKQYKLLRMRGDRIRFTHSEVFPASLNYQEVKKHSVSPQGMYKMKFYRTPLFGKGKKKKNPHEG